MEVGAGEQEEQRLILQNRQHAEEVLLDALSGIQRVTRLDRLPFQSFEIVYFTRYENYSRSHPATEWKTLSPCNSLRCRHGSVSDISGCFMHGAQKCFVSKPADNFNLKTFETQIFFSVSETKTAFQNSLQLSAKAHKLKMGPNCRRSLCDDVVQRRQTTLTLIAST